MLVQPFGHVSVAARSANRAACRRQDSKRASLSVADLRPNRFGLTLPPRAEEVALEFV